MSDTTYRLARLFFAPPLWLNSRPLVLHAERAAITGGCILAANHLGPFDIPLLIRHTPRPIDFLGRTEFQRNRATTWLFSLFNTFYVDRGAPDTSAALSAVRRLQSGRLVGIFPEGAIRSADDSVLSGGPIKTGIARLARLADVPVIPCVVLGGNQYMNARSWVPLPPTRYGLIYGVPLQIPAGVEESAGESRLLEQLQTAFVHLCGELLSALGWRTFNGP